MNRFRHTSLFATLAFLLIGGGAAPAAEPAKPNVVLILIDDMGWTDLACFGSDLYETPSIDQLARDGMKFTQAYSACTVCSPSRAAVLTGKYPSRLHITDWIPGQMPANPKLLVPDWTKFLPLEETTIAEVFHAAGYATASIGKWHLGGEQYYPEKHGFDLNIAGTFAPQPPSYFAPWKIPTLAEGSQGEYLTDRLGEEAVQFIERSKDRPFFLYLPHFGVHTPIQGRADLVEKYRQKLRLHPELKHRNPEYAAMVESVDHAVGRVRQKLEELKLADRTIIVFTSDNGGRVTVDNSSGLPTTSNLPLRVGKGSCYEGGTRVPLIVHWPGVTQPGSICDTPVIGADYYPTLLQMAGVNDLPGHQPDGVSLVPLLRQTGGLERDALYWHYPHHQHYQLGGTMPYGAIRAGDFKLIELYDDDRVELYNLRDAVGEQHDLAAQMPDKTRELRARLHDWREKVGAQMPTPNPAYDPTKPQHVPPHVPPQGKKKAGKRK
ncbi:MAG: sulfatase [Planctomycetes bacterium]|nr:sulfatase [Planctomycetota bacterium]